MITDKRSELECRLPEVSIVIPTLREYESLRILIPQIKLACEESNLLFEIIIVDDESEIKTKNLIESFSETINIKLIAHENKLGLAQSALKGFNLSKGEFIVLMDGDGSHNPRYIPMLINPLASGSKDITVGSRYIKNSGINKWNFTRIVISKIGALITRPICKVRDPGSGFIAFRRNSINLENIRPLSWKIGLELFSQKPDSIEEIPIYFESRYAGKSKFDLKTVKEFIFHLFNLYLFKFTKKYSEMLK